MYSTSLEDIQSIENIKNQPLGKIPWEFRERFTGYGISHLWYGGACIDLPYTPDNDTHRYMLYYSPINMWLKSDNLEDAIVEAESLIKSKVNETYKTFNFLIEK